MWLALADIQKDRLVLDFAGRSWEATLSSAGSVCNGQIGEAQLHCIVGLTVTADGVCSREVSFDQSGGGKVKTTLAMTPTPGTLLIMLGHTPRSAQADSSIMTDRKYETTNIPTIPCHYFAGNRDQIPHRWLAATR